MKAIRHEGKSLLYLTIEPDDYDSAQRYPMIVLLHGFGANMQDLASLAPAIDRQGYVYACPQAPMAIPLGPGYTGYGWTPRGADATPQDVQRAEDALDTFFGEVMEQYRVAPGKAVLMGFSQGGGMTYRCGLRQPHLFAGLAILSGTLPVSDQLRQHLPAQRSQPIFVAHGVQDMVLPVERGRAGRDFLLSESYQPKYTEYHMGHEISPEVLADLVPWVQQVLPPLGATV